MDVFIGSIQVFGFNFNPRSWALCNGQIESIQSNTALFSLLGTSYGGDGRTTYALPDLRGRSAVGMGQGPGLSHYFIGESAGNEKMSLTSAEMPSHTHYPIYSGGTASGAVVNVAKVQGGHQMPSAGDYIGMPGNSFGTAPEGNLYVDSAAAGNAGIVPIGGVIGGGFDNSALTIEPTGGNESFSIVQPFLVNNDSIALFGIYPSRN
ncbi:phage tail protein [Marinomonas algicola]|uniref:phage tail protein n=1 Tax=Marinomonas algicola TaxID=2773454 RepID=UPI0017484C05|nr:tail fiber protein [Marinomonas algicola]